MVRKLIYSSLFVFLFQIAGFAQFEDTTPMRDPQHMATAEQLTEDLNTRLSLTTEQSEEIKEILIDYQEKVAIHEGEADEADQGMNNETDFNTGNETDAVETETETEVDNFPSQTEVETETDVQTETESGVETETEVETETQTEVPPSDNPSDIGTGETQTDMGTEFSTDPQQEADKAIEQVLNESQKVTWSVIKDAWWRDVNSRFGWDKETE